MWFPIPEWSLRAGSQKDLRVIPRAAVVTLLFLTCLTNSSSIFSQVPEPPSSKNDAFEVLTRGPIHEAFAELVGRDPTPGIFVKIKPPEPIGELPPEVKTAEDVIWFSGYWSWDEDRNDFVWISGVWRVPPPGQRWVPGYWAEVEGGFQWTAGFWISVHADELEYMENPPESLENGPSSPAPADDYFWVPGCWVYQNEGYRWRPGYWSRHRPDWVWVPDRFVWTPHGCIFVLGYWDHGVGDRGTVFAPVYVDSASRHTDYHYTPSCVISGTSFYLHLWSRPADRHYCFGDYYDDKHAGYRIFRWYDYHRGRHGYCPLYVHYMHRHRHDAHEHLHRMHAWNRYYKKNRHLRPRHTFSDQREFARRHADDTHARHSVLGRTLAEAAERSKHRDRFVRLSEAGRNQLARDARRIQQITSKRRRGGRKGVTPAATDGEGQSASRRETLNLSGVGHSPRHGLSNTSDGSGRNDKGSRQRFLSRDDNESSKRSKRGDDDGVRKRAKRRDYSGARNLTKRRDDNESSKRSKRGDDDGARKRAKRRDYSGARNLTKRRDDSGARNRTKRRNDSGTRNRTKRRNDSGARNRTKRRGDGGSRRRSKGRSRSSRGRDD